MGLIIRTFHLVNGLASRLVSIFERRNPEALLEVEKERLRKVVGRYNEGLVSHAALAERLKIQVADGEAKVAETTAKTQALVKAAETKAAGRYALQLKEATARLAEDRKQLTAAEDTFRHLVSTRDVAVAEARTRIEQLRRQIGDLKVNRAVADLQGMANAMMDDFNAPGDSLNRLQEMVAEEREKARARTRVVTSTTSASDIAAREIEQDALAAQALAEFMERDRPPSRQSLLPDYSGEIDVVAEPKRRPHPSQH